MDLDGSQEMVIGPKGRACANRRALAPFISSKSVASGNLTMYQLCDSKAMSALLSCPDVSVPLHCHESLP